MTDDSGFDDALAALEAEQGVEPEAEERVWDDDLIPDVDSGYEPTEQDLEIDDILARVGIIDAYRRWCGKSEPKPGKRTEGIKVSCPNPLHPDADPSAWVNTEKDVGTCGSCDLGFDIFDIAAWHFGFDVPGYKSGKNFPDLKRRMAEDLGYVVTVTRTLGGDTATVVHAPIPGDAGAEPEPEPEQSDDDLVAGVVAAAGPAESAAVVSLAERLVDMDDILLDYPELDWDAILPADSFMRTWMEVTRHDDLPEEFYFWLGMIALGFAIGRDVVLADNPEVRGNLYVCLYGHTGMGKSRSIGALTHLLREALPYDHDDPSSSGAYMVPSPGSPEALVDAFSKPISDPGGGIMGYGKVRGLIRFDELSTLIGRSNRAGNPMKPMLMEFYDGYHAVEHKTRGAGHVMADGYFASTLTTTQPKAIRQLLVQADADSGFANRWIFAAGQEKEKVSYGRKPLELDKAVGPLRKVRGWAAMPMSGRRLELTGGAFTVWDEFFHQTLVPSQRDDESNLLTRADLLLKKCILLFAADRLEPVPTEQCVRDALALWGYLKKSYGLVSPEIGIGEFEHIRKAIAEYCIAHEARHSKPPSLRDISRALARHKFAGDLMVKVIKTMIELQEIEEIPATNTRGPKKPMYRYVSA